MLRSRLGLNICKQTLILLSGFTLLTACEGNIELTWKPGTSVEISGEVIPLKNTDQSVAMCNNTTISLYKLSNNGHRIFPALAQSLLKTDGSYSFSKIKDLGVQTKGQSLLTPLLVEATGCNKSFARILTSTKKQDLTWGSTLLSFLSSSIDAANILGADKEKLAQLTDALSSYSDSASSYNALTTNTELQQLFQEVFKSTPNTLQQAAPIALEIVAPTQLREIESAQFSITSKQWRGDYQYAYLWSIDGVTLSTQSTFNYTPTANSKKSYSLVVYWGQDNGSGQLDQTKPYQSRTYILNIENNVLPSVPSFALASNYVNTASISLNINTGAGLNNCASFSKLAITETATPPANSAHYTIQCSVDTTQNFVYTLQNTQIGTHTIYLWSLDERGTRSASPQTANVYYNNLPPQIFITSPNANGLPSSTVLALQGTCESLSGDVTITGDFTGSPVTTSCTADAFAYSVSLSGADGVKSLTAVQTNIFSTVGSMSINVLKDTTLSQFQNLALLPGVIGNNPLPSISGETEALSVVALYSLPSCLGTVMADTTAANDGTFTFAPNTALIDGVYNFYLKATDPAGNTICSTTPLSYTLDTVAPTAVLSSVAVGSINTLPIQVAVNFSENVTGLSLSDFSTTNATAANLTGSGSSYNLELIALTQGSFGITLSANTVLDAALNNNVASNTLSRSYDSVAPNLTITSPTEASHRNSTTLTATGACETGLNVSFTGSGLTTNTSAPCTSSSFTATLTLTTGDESKNFTASQTDVAGNTATVSRAVTLDTLAPSLSFTSAATQNVFTNTNTGTLSGSCETGVTVQVSGGVDTNSTTCSGGVWSYTTVARTTDAVRNYTFTQTDAAGNSTNISGSWTRDTVAPSMTLTSPPANFAAQNGVTLTGTCENALPVIASGSGLNSAITINCNSGTYSQFVYFSDNDGTKAFTISQTDLAGNVTSVNRNYVKDTTAPILTQTLNASPYRTNTNTASFGGACETGITIYVTGAQTTSIACTANAWSFTTASQTTDSSRSYTFTSTDSANNQSQISAVWIRDTVAPALAFTSEVNFVTSGNNVNFQGACETGYDITIAGGTDTGTLSCSTGSWSYTVATKTLDAIYNYSFTQTDAATNATTINGSWTRSTSGPTITISQTSGQKLNTATFLITGTCSGGNAGSNGNIQITGSATGTTGCSSTDNSIGTWSYLASPVADGNYNYTFTLTDNFGVPRSSAVSFNWMRDTIQPVITAGSFNINGGLSTTPVPYNPVAFSATDNLSYVAKFCLKNTSTLPTSQDNCWQSVNIVSGVSPANSVNITNYLYNIGILPQLHDIYLWVMDGAGNISTNTATLNQDHASITLAPVAPPSVTTVLASNSDTMNGLESERNISGGSDVYIRWTASGPSLSATPITLYFSTNDTTWTQIQANLANGINNCSSITGSGTASSSATGCYKWETGSPSSSYYRVRVSVTNTLGATTFANSLPVNTSSFRIIAGNTETGLNGAATSALFMSEYSINQWVDAQNMVIDSKGILYFRDITIGIVYIDPADGKMKKLISSGATTSGLGDGGAVSSAQLRNPIAMAIDGKDRIVVFDRDRIRRIDLRQNPPTIQTIIGGGGLTTDTIADAKQLSITAIKNGLVESQAKQTLAVMPNGDIYFNSENKSMYQSKRIRKYTDATGQITSINLTGSAIDGQGVSVADFTKCGHAPPLVVYDKATSEIQKMYIMSQNGNPANTDCTSTPIAVGAQFSTMLRVNPQTGALDNSAPHPAPYGVWLAWAHPFQSLDGKAYIIDKGYGSIHRFDEINNSWVKILGHPSNMLGTCEDGTSPLNCRFDPGGAFVDAFGQLYFGDRGRIRTIINNQVKTLYGQSLNFGDTGLAVNARFGSIRAVNRVPSTSSLVIADSVAQKFRMFTKNSTIDTIAGNGILGSISTGTPATASPLRVEYNGPSPLLLDNTENIYYAGIAHAITVLPNTYRTSPTTTNWRRATDINLKNYFDHANTAQAFYTPSSSGLQAGDVHGGFNILHLIGVNQNSILFYAQRHFGGTNVDHTMAEIDTTTGIYTINTTAFAWTGNYCANGTQNSSCNAVTNTRNNTAASYDTDRSAWLFLHLDGRNISTMTKGASGSIQAETVFNNVASSFIFKRYPAHSAHRYYYYCSESNGRIYIRNADTNNEQALNWPISSLKCAGLQMTYDETSNSLIFPFTQNGMSGVAEILDIHPSLYGL